MSEAMGRAKTRGTVYTQVFKQTAVRLVESGQTVASVGRSLRVPEQTLSYWVHTLSGQTAEQMRLARSQVRQTEIAELRTKESKLTRSRAKQRVISRVQAKQKKISGLQAEWVSAKQSKLNHLQVERLSAMQAKLECSRATRSKAKLARRERSEKHFGRLQGLRTEEILGPFAVERRPQANQSFVFETEGQFTAISHDLLTGYPSPRSNKKDVVTVDELTARIHAVITTEYRFATATPQHLLCAAIRLIARWSNGPLQRNLSGVGDGLRSEDCATLWKTD